MEAASKIDTELIRIFEDNFCIRVKFELTGVSTPSSTGLHACFVLDRSGSMAGGPIRDAKGALLSFITKMEKLGIPVTVISFNNSTEEATSTALGYEGLRTWAEKIDGRGGTLFRYVFECMEKKFVNEHLDNTFVMFLSDGQDNDGLAKLVPYLEKFKKTILTNNLTSSIHTIGFSEDHDAKLLTALTTYGTKAGTYQYLERDGRIPVAVNNATEFLYQSSMWGQYIGGGQPPSKLEISDDEKNANLHYATVFVREQDLAEGKIEIFFQGKKMEFKADLRRVDRLELEDEVHLFTNFLSSTVLQVLERRQNKQLTKEAAATLTAQVTRMDKRLDEMMAGIKKQRSLQRKQMMPFCLQAKDLVTEFYAVLKEDVAAELSTVKLAQLNRLAYQNILQRSLLKKINKRVGENAGMLQEIDQEINKVLSGMNFKEIGEKYKETIENYGHCIISYRDWYDALQDGDCFCLTFDAQRAEGGIMDPSLVVIKTINASCLTAESFLDSALFITRAGQIIKGVGVHGASAGTLVKGLPDEVITGILPLYINEEHWQVARLRIKPLLAWTIAQDVLAYESRQLAVLPFLLLAKGAIEQNTDFKKRQYQMVLETCQAIYRDNKGLILPEVKARLAEYATKPEVRTTDSISNNRVFLVHTYVAAKAGDVDGKTLAPIFPLLVEEELRRNGPKLDVDRHELCLKLLNVDVAHDVVPFINAFIEELHQQQRSQTSSSAEKFRMLLKEKHIEAKEEEKAPAASPPKEAKEAKEEAKEEVKVPTAICDYAQKKLDLYNAQFQNADWNVPLTVKLLSLYDMKPYTTVQELGIDTPAKQLAFILQTITQKANADRRDAINAGKFISVFDEAAATAYFKKEYTDTVVLERNNQKSKILAEQQKLSSSASAPLFAATKDVMEAAGLVLGTLRGTQSFKHLHRALRIPHCPLVIEKVKMLTSGQYLGIKLIMDAPTNPKEVSNGFFTWAPKKKHAYKIWKPNREEGTLVQWQEAFPTLKQYLEDQEKRAQGIFVPYRHPRRNVNDPRHHTQAAAGASGAAGAQSKHSKKKKKGKKK